MSSELGPPWASLRTTASHTIGIPHLVELLDVVPATASAEDYRTAVVEHNALGRPTGAGRARTFRHLRELYLLDPTRPEFRILRHLWTTAGPDRQLLAGLLAYTRDEVLRSTWPAIAAAAPGNRVSSDDLSTASRESFGDRIGEATIAKIGRNTGASWTQSGHLQGRANKVRLPLAPGPSAIAYATYLAYSADHRGADLLDTPWLAVLDIPAARKRDALLSAHAAGLLTVRTSGNVIDVDLTPILAAAE